MDKMYTIQEVAKAMSVSIITVRRWIAGEKIQYTRIGKTIRVSETELKRLQKGE